MDPSEFRIEEMNLTGLGNLAFIALNHPDSTFRGHYLRIIERLQEEVK